MAESFFEELAQNSRRRVLCVKIKTVLSQHTYSEAGELLYVGSSPLLR